MKTLIVVVVLTVLVACVAHLGDASPGRNCKVFPCPNEYKPVCAENLRSVKENFHNECYMKLRNCQKNESFKKLHNGKCKVYGRPKPIHA